MNEGRVVLRYVSSLRLCLFNMVRKLWPHDHINVFFPPLSKNTGQRYYR